MWKLPLPLALLFLVCCSSLVLTGVHASWFGDPCSYHPHALQQLRSRLSSVVGQQYATEAIYAHVQHHLERYEQSRIIANRPEDQHHHVSLNKPLVLSFHGPTGTGKSLTAASISGALFHKAASSHVHTYHGSDFSGATPAQVADSVAFLKREFSKHVQRCPLALFIIEEIHLMAPGVLDALRHFMDAQAPNTRVKIDAEPTAHGGGGGGARSGSDATARSQDRLEPDAADAEDDADLDAPDVSGSRSRRASAASGRSGASSRSSGSSGPTSVAINFSHVIWLFTTNIGSQQVQKVAYDAAKAGKPRESLSPTLLHEMLLSSLAHSEQLQLLRDASVLSALVPFFPLFKAHVKECAEVQLQFRRRFWLHQRQLANLTWDASVLNYAASQLKYQGPISIYGCKNIHEILTHALLSHLTREWRRLDEESAAKNEELMRDRRVSTARKFLSYGANLLRQATHLFTGPEWSMAAANVTMRVEEGEEVIVFDIEEPLSTPPPRLANGSVDPAAAQSKKSQIRKSLHAYAHGNAYHTVQETNRPGKHAHMTDDPDVAEDTAGAHNAGARPKEDL